MQQGTGAEQMCAERRTLSTGREDETGAVVGQYWRSGEGRGGREEANVRGTPRMKYRAQGACLDHGIVRKARESGEWGCEGSRESESGRALARPSTSRIKVIVAH